MKFMLKSDRARRPVVLAADGGDGGRQGSVGALRGLTAGAMRPSVCTESEKENIDKESNRRDLGISREVSSELSTDRGNGPNRSYLAAANPPGRYGYLAGFLGTLR